MTEEQEWEAVRAALRAAGVDPTDLARFVNAPNPAIRGLEPSTFDWRRAYPVLLEWLPRVQARPVVDTLASRIRESGKRSESARVLIAKYREQPTWQLGDAIARTMTPRSTATSSNSAPTRALATSGRCSSMPSGGSRQMRRGR